MGDFGYTVCISALHPQKDTPEYIDKPGKAEKRPLGIPTIRDRIVQECIRIVLEPILEAQFWEHSYGFRPMRDTHQALARVTDLVHITGYHWIVEGDISKCFDKIDHRILLKRLYHVGIHDRRVIQIVKAMLEAGIIGECEVNEEGVRTCIHNRKRCPGEGFFRQTRQIFAGILVCMARKFNDVWREKTRLGGV